MSELVPYQPNEVAAPRMRFRCTVCTGEVGSMQGSYEDAIDLLTALGWRCGANMICPQCLDKRKRAFKRTFDEI